MHVRLIVKLSPGVGESVSNLVCLHVSRDGLKTCPTSRPVAAGRGHQLLITQNEEACIENGWIYSELYNYREEYV